MHMQVHVSIKGVGGWGRDVTDTGVNPEVRHQQQEVIIIANYISHELKCSSWRNKEKHGCYGEF